VKKPGPPSIPISVRVRERERGREKPKESTTGGGSRSISSLQHQVCAYEVGDFPSPTEED